MKTFNVIYKNRSDEQHELHFIKVEAESHSSALEQVNEMNSDYKAVSIASSTFVTLYKRYAKCYNKILAMGKGNVYVFRDIDEFLDESCYSTPFIEILGSQITVESLTPTSLLVADDRAHIELYEMSDYTLLQLIEWLEPIVNIRLKGIKLDKH